MTCFLTPAGDPFFCGTYLPDGAAAAACSPTPCQAWADDGATGCWPARRSVAAQLRRQRRPPRCRRGLDAEALRRRRAAAAPATYDEAHGGFGGAPKFPPSMVLEFLLRHHERTGSADALRDGRGTCEAMARGGMYDQLGGGFARYSRRRRAGWCRTSRRCSTTTRCCCGSTRTSWRATGDPLARRVAEETADFLLRDLRTDEGGFASALDADTRRRRGPDLRLDPRAARRGAGRRRRRVGRGAARGHRRRAPSSTAASTLQLPRRPRRPRALGSACGPAARRARPAPAARPRRQGRHGLERAGGRSPSPRPGPRSAVPTWVAAAGGRGGPAARRGTWSTAGCAASSRGGVVGAAAGVLDDHGVLAEALLALHQATGAARWLERAGELLDLALAHFADPTHPAPSSTPRTTPRPCCTGPGRSPTTPRRAGPPRWPGRCSRRRVLVDRPAAVPRRPRRPRCGRRARWPQRFPRFAGHWLTVAEAAARGPLQVAVVGAEPDRAALRRRTPGRSRPGGTVVVRRRCRTPRACRCSRTARWSTARPAAYVCRGFVCDRPVTTARRAHRRPPR